jgi:hypothetical protein
VQTGDLFPTAGANLVHLGDDAYTGSSNSQFQAKTSGLVSRIDLGALAASTNYTGLTLQLAMRGVDVTTYQCLDTLTLYQSTDGGPTGRTNVRSLSLGQSPADGSFAVQTFTLDQSYANNLQSSLGDLWIELTAGACPGNGIDDFEFVNVHATLSF